MNPLQRELELRSQHETLITRMEEVGAEVERAEAGTAEHRELETQYEELNQQGRLLEEKIEQAQASQRARAKFKPMPLAGGGIARVSVNEPDMYEREGRSFLVDLYRAQVRGDVAASERIGQHHQYEAEKRAIDTGTLGGIIPPQYLVDLYAKAPRNGRVYADNVNRQELPEVGMSVIVPRLTRGTAAGIQAAEGDTVATQDPEETDLTVPVRTIAGYVPVSRQTLERASYSEAILFEDLVARYFAALDTGCLNGSGDSGEILGVLQTDDTESVTISSWSIASLWGALADAQQRIATNVGGLGYAADRIVFHPRRWGAIAAELDNQDRPLLLPAGSGGVGFNIAGSGSVAEYGRVGELFGLPCFVDANMPVTLGGSTNQDAILVYSSRAVHIWERMEDPVTLGFEQQAGTALMVQLICYGYASFSAGRYPGATAVLTGAGCSTPSF